MIQNHLLSALPEAARKDLFSHVTQVSVSVGEVLHRAEEEIQYVYFPETCVISMLASMHEGSTVEVGVVGNEGMLGLRVLLEVKKTPHSAVVQVAGTALNYGQGHGFTCHSFRHTAIAHWDGSHRQRRRKRDEVERSQDA